MQRSFWSESWSQPFQSEPHAPRNWPVKHAAATASRAINTVWSHRCYMHHLESITHVIQNLCCRASRGFSTTVSNRPCRVSWVCRIYLTIKKFWFLRYVVKNAWHIQLPESEPWNANKKWFGNQRLQRWLCLNDPARVWSLPFVDRYHGLIFLLKTKNSYYM